MQWLGIFLQRDIFFFNVALERRKALAEKRGIHSVVLNLKPVSSTECRRLVLRPTSTQKDTLLLSSESKASMVRRDGRVGSGLVAMAMYGIGCTLKVLHRLFSTILNPPPPPTTP